MASQKTITGRTGIDSIKQTSAQATAQTSARTGRRSSTSRRAGSDSSTAVSARKSESSSLSEALAGSEVTRVTRPHVQVQHTEGGGQEQTTFDDIGVHLTVRFRWVAKGVGPHVKA